jgi:hypothetical protein
LLKNKSIGIIGVRGIGRIYLRELLTLGVKKIFILGKSYKQSLKNKRELELSTNIEIIPCKNMNDFKNKKLDLICICSPTNTHLNLINKLSKTKSKLLIEKPLFDIKNLSYKKIYKITNNLFENNKTNILTNLPLVEYAKSLKSKFKIDKNKLSKINFKYYTSGRHIYKNIAIDLLPHAISFLLSLNYIKKKNILIDSIKMKKNSWKINFSFKKINCLFDFNQNIQRKKSILQVKLNNKSYKRIQKRNINRSIKNIEFIERGKQIKKINNPMSESIKKNIYKLFSNRVNRKDIEIQKSIILLMAFFVNKNGN